MNLIDKLDKLISPGTDQGKHVDNYKYIDVNKPGARNVDSKLRDVYDESNRQAYNDPDTSKPDSEWWIWAGAWTIGVWIFGFAILPKLSTVFPFNMIFNFKLTLRSGFHIILIGLLVGAGTMGVFYLNRQNDHAGKREARKLLAPYLNDAHIARPVDLPQMYDIVPDNKVHFDIDVTSLLSHLMIRQTPGLNGKDNKVHFDNKFSQSLFDLAKLPHQSHIRKLYNASKLPYNPDHAFGKTPGNTVKDVINHTWYVPDYEDPKSQDPAGIYIVSTRPENTVLISETRGGKGQKYIEPILDVWSRQKVLPNIVVTDLKMELLRMSLKTFTIRGYNVKALNLLTDSKTDAINFLGYAVDEAIRGNVTEMESRVKQIADIFYPNDAKGGSDPFWNTSASSVFKRTVYCLIEFYSEKTQRIQEDTNLSNETKLQKIDEEWGHVTLFNAYQFVVQLAAKSYPREFFQKIYKDGKDPDPTADTKSALSIYVDAVEQLPINPIREKIANQDGAIKSGASSEKMMASIYSICLMGMIFFTDDKIIKLTSARPSQNLDITGFGFPRRMAVRFEHNYAIRHTLVGQVTNWQAFHDPEMKHPYYDEKNGKKDYSPYCYQGGIDKYRWADSYFKGKFETHKPTYLKLTVYDHDGYQQGSDLNLKICEFNFEFKKSFRKSYSGRVYLHNPITGQREVQGGILNEYSYDPMTKKVTYIQSSTTKKEPSLILDQKGRRVEVKYNLITGYDIHYSDKPTALFLVAPPQTSGYNKVLLITIDMLYNQQVSTGFLAFSNQKPLYYTKYLLDEFGNMESEGKGVPNLDKKLTSGLGSNQQFTMVLQSLTQLKSIYGDQAPTLIGNAQKYFFMKSKDKDLIKQLMDMNGKKHIIKDSSVNFDKPVGGYHLMDTINPKNGSSRPHIATTTGTEELPVISENDYLRLTDDPADGNAIVSSGLDPIWSQGSTIMPMSFKLLENRTGGKGEDLVLTNLPTMADTTDFDALENMPDFDKMLAQRMDEAVLAPKVMDLYQKVNHLTDNQINHMDSETYSAIIMRGIYQNMQNNVDVGVKNTATTNNFRQNDNKFNATFNKASEDNQDAYTDKALKAGDERSEAFNRNRDEIIAKIKAQRQRIVNNDTSMRNQIYKSDTYDDIKTKSIKTDGFDQNIQVVMNHFNNDKLYCNGTITQSQLINWPLDQPLQEGQAIQGVSNLKVVISMAVNDCLPNFINDPDFRLSGRDLQFNDGSMAVQCTNNIDASEKYEPSDKFMIFLAKNRDWTHIANGNFQSAMIHAMKERGLIN